MIVKDMRRGGTRQGGGRPLGRTQAGCSGTAHDATVSRLAAVDLRAVLHSPPEGWSLPQVPASASRLDLWRAKLTVDTANGRGESSELAPRMLSRLERRRPAPTVPSRTLVCRYLSAPVSAMPLVSIRADRLSRKCACRCPIASR
jgi:hypothetical protein